MDTPANLTEAAKADFIEKVVKPRAEKFARLEGLLEAAYEEAMSLDNDDFETGWRAGLIGYLDMGIARGRIRCIAGAVAEAERLTFEAHRKETDIAERNGIDVPNIDADGGGGR